MRILRLKVAVVSCLWVLLASVNVANATNIQKVTSEIAANLITVNEDNLSITFTEQHTDMALNSRLSVSEPKSITIFVLGLIILVLRRVHKAQIKNPRT